MSEVILPEVDATMDAFNHYIESINKGEGNIGNFYSRQHQIQNDEGELDDIIFEVKWDKDLREILVGPSVWENGVEYTVQTTQTFKLPKPDINNPMSMINTFGIIYEAICQAQEGKLRYNDLEAMSPITKETMESFIKIFKAVMEVPSMHEHGLVFIARSTRMRDLILSLFNYFIRKEKNDDTIFLDDTQVQPRDAGNYIGNEIQKLKYLLEIKTIDTDQLQNHTLEYYWSKLNAADNLDPETLGAKIVIFNGKDFAVIEDDYEAMQMRLAKYGILCFDV